MIVLFIHPHAPGQYEHIANALVCRGDDVHFICQNIVKRAPQITYHQYQLSSSNDSPLQEPLAADFIYATRRAKAVAELCAALKSKGFMPDVIFGHGGWGDTLYVKDIFDHAPLINYIEFYYHAKGMDLGFDPEFDPLFIDDKRLQARNATLAMSVLRSDKTTTPTDWQRSVLPDIFQARTEVLHEGIDTQVVSPSDSALFNIPSSAVTLSRRDRVITFVSRSLEPYRGFPTFMRALPSVLRECPDAQVVIVGSEGTSYGAALPSGNSHKKLLLAELADVLPLDRVHFCGTVTHEQFLQVLRISSAHVYLTYPLFLSWSCLEAMAAACVVIGSRTGPVTDVIEDGHNGLLVDFFDVDMLSRTLINVIKKPKSTAALRKHARETIKSRFDLHHRCLPQWLALADAR